MLALWEALAAGLGIGILIGWNMRVVLDHEADVRVMTDVAEQLLGMVR